MAYELTLAQRNLLARLNDCNREVDPADRNALIKLVEELVERVKTSAEIPTASGVLKSCPFSELRDAMSPEAQERVATQAQEMAAALEQQPDQRVIKNLVWRTKLDKVYDCYVEREAEYEGTLKVIGPDGKEILSKTVGLSYGAIFGPDMNDVALWEGMCCMAVDNLEKPSEDAQTPPGSASQNPA
jgi:hypothetical protein